MIGTLVVLTGVCFLAHIAMRAGFVSALLLFRHLHGGIAAQQFIDSNHILLQLTKKHFVGIWTLVESQGKVVVRSRTAYNLESKGKGLQAAMILCRVTDLGTGFCHRALATSFLCFNSVGNLIQGNFLGTSGEMGHSGG